MAEMKWYENPVADQSPIISSRVRLARNLRKYPFSIMINADASQKMIDEVVGSVKSEYLPIANQFEYIDLNKTDDIHKLAMVEKHEISLELLKYDRPKALLLKDDESVGIMINEEDHIRIQTIYPGKNMNSAYEMAVRMDNLIEETVEYAFDEDFGYLTSCPSNTGTGLRASYMAHIPMLEKTGKLPGLSTALAKFGMTIRGIYGEGSESAGSIYQISNQITLGKSEEEILQSLDSVVQQIIENETATLEAVRSSQGLFLEDNIFRSLGILRSARQMSMKEAMGLLSAVRLGYLSGILKEGKPEQPIYSIMMAVEPGNLQRNYNRAMSEQERDMVRADYLRSVFGQM